MKRWFYALILSPLWMHPFCLATAATDHPQHPGHFSKQELTQMLQQDPHLKPDKVQRMVNAVANKLGTDGQGRLRLKGVLRGRGLHGALFRDSRTWAFDGSYIAADTRQLVRHKNLYYAKFKNSGLKLELGYKWIYLFVPDGLDVRELDQAVFGHGVATSLSFIYTAVPLSLEAGWMPGKNRSGNLFFVAPEVGVLISLTFPKIKFELNPYFAIPGQHSLL
ncbi:MAG: hypothetical protein OXT67_11780 [Zetaproteobacteria bacterium]|nr:hypothetical protein [Zetaproteobacteria bacterium]